MRTVARLQAFAASLASTVDCFDLMGERLRTLQLDEPVEIINRVYLSVAKQFSRPDTTFGVHRTRGIPTELGRTR